MADNFRLPLIAWVMGALMAGLLVAVTIGTVYLTWDLWHEYGFSRYTAIQIIGLPVCMLAAWMSMIGAIIIVRAKMRDTSNPKEHISDR